MKNATLHILVTRKGNTREIPVRSMRLSRAIRQYRETRDSNADSYVALVRRVGSEDFIQFSHRPR